MAPSTSVAALSTQDQSATENDKLTLEFPEITATTSTIRTWISTWFSKRDLVVLDSALAKVAWDGRHLHRMMIPDESVPDLVRWGFDISYARIISQDIKELRMKKSSSYGWMWIVNCLTYAFGGLLFTLGVCWALLYLQQNDR